MESVLAAVLTSPGVMGGLLLDDSGRVLVRSLPAMFDPDQVASAASVLSEQQIGLEDATGGVRMSEIRFELGKVISRPAGDKTIVLVCENSANIQLLSIGLNVASKKLEKMPAIASVPSVTVAPPVAPARVATELTPPLHSSTGWTFKPLQVEKGKILLHVQIVEKNGGTFWDSMQETVSINRITCRAIWRHYNQRPSKKFMLKNPSNGKQIIVPLSVIEDDQEALYDGKALLTLAAVESLGLAEGTLVSVEVPIGTGFLGWEGI